MTSASGETCPLHGSSLFKIAGFTMLIAILIYLINYRYQLSLKTKNQN